MTKKIITSLAILFTIMFAVSSCKKDSVAEEIDLAESAEGTYDVYYIQQGESAGNLPSGGNSATVKVRRVEKDKVNLTITILIQGEQPQTGDVDADLKKESSSVAMYSGTDKIGTINGDELELRGNSPGEELIIKARK